jgi:hypothetical protein
MATNPISLAELNHMRASEEDSLDLVRGIYHNIKEYRLHNLDAYTEAAHRAFLELKRNIDDLLPMRLGAFQSPPNVKHRKRKANWTTPPNNGDPPSRNNNTRRFNGAKSVNNARARETRNANARRANALRRLNAANSAAPGGTLRYNANNANLG